MEMVKQSSEIGSVQSKLVVIYIQVEDLIDHPLQPLLKIAQWYATGVIFELTL